MTSKSAIKKQLILDSAIKVFADKGYHYATIDDIAKDAGIAKGSVHAYFENKLDLLLSSILLFWQLINDANAQKIKNNENPVVALKAIFSTFQDILLHDKQSLYWGKILQEGLPKIHMIKSKILQQKKTAIDRERKKLIQTIDDVITRGQQQGLIKSSINPQVLRQILGGSSQLLVYGLFMQFSQGEGIGYEQQNVRDAMDLLIDTFKA
jgi:AcrR family transcriptional regulator